MGNSCDRGSIPSRSKSPRSWNPGARLAMLAMLALLGLQALGGCALNYAEGQERERQKRWEEALISYRLALIEDPGDEDYQAAVLRASKVVARENFDRYKEFLSKKAFRRAYGRLLDAARQDPEFEPVKEEMGKWSRVLIGGQVVFDLEVAQPAISLADQITLVARFNSPNPGETVDAVIDIDTGLFFVEDLLYDRPDELLTFYSLNAIGVKLVYGRSRIKKFTSNEFVRFINIRNPVLGEIKGKLLVDGNGALKPVGKHRENLTSVPWIEPEARTQPNPHYALTIDGHTIQVATQEGNADFTPRYLYLNKRDRRIFVDFGRYRVKLLPEGRNWTLRRLPLGKEDYFSGLLRNIALQPYFFYREGIFTFVPARSG